MGTFPSRSNNINVIVNPLHSTHTCCICLDIIYADFMWCKVCDKPTHGKCLKKWKKNTCPLCRAKF